MNLPDAPIAHEGFFATHFFTVKDQEKSKVGGPSLRLRSGQALSRFLRKGGVGVCASIRGTPERRIQ